MDYADYLTIGGAVVARTTKSGVIVGRLAGGSGGQVVLTCHRWLRQWQGVGGEGSVFDLVASNVRPQRRGPLIPGLAVFGADVYAISEAAYARLAGDD